MTFPLTPEGKTLVVVFVYGPGSRGHATSEQRSSVVGAKGIPLKENEYFAVPPLTLVPGGISALSVIEESWPGTTGSGRREPLVNLKTDVPFEQSVTELVADAFRIANAAASAVKRPITYL